MSAWVLIISDSSPVETVEKHDDTILKTEQGNAKTTK